MATRRMFSKRIINSARFLKMPISTQALYFHLGLHADDDGVVEAYYVIKQIGCSEDDLRVLASKGFIQVLNDDLVAYITDWNENNYIRADRKIDSIYKNLLVSMNPDIKLIEKRPRADAKPKVIDTTYSGSDGENDDGQPTDNQRTTNGQSTDGIGKVRLGQESLEQESLKQVSLKKEGVEKNNRRSQINYQEIIDLFNDTCVSLPRVTTLSQARKKAIKARLKTFDIDDFKMMFVKAQESDFLKGRNPRNWFATFDWMIKDANFGKILEGNYDNKRHLGFNDESDYYERLTRWAES